MIVRSAGPTIARDRHADPPQQVRTQLRVATKNLHEKLDAQLGALCSQGLDGYRRFLTCSATALLPLERALNEAGVSATIPDWPARRRSRALQLDLQELNLPVPDFPAAPHMEGDAYQFGVVYVLEGSRLGAHYILRALRENLGTDGFGSAHYLSHGTGQSLWPTFLEQLEASDVVRRHPEQAVAGAQSAFGQFLSAEAELRRHL